LLKKICNHCQSKFLTIVKVNFQSINYFWIVSRPKVEVAKKMMKDQATCSKGGKSQISFPYFDAQTSLFCGWSYYGRNLRGRHKNRGLCRQKMAWVLRSTLTITLCVDRFWLRHLCRHWGLCRLTEMSLGRHWPSSMSTLRPKSKSVDLKHDGQCRHKWRSQTMST